MACCHVPILPTSSKKAADGVGTPYPLIPPNFRGTKKDIPVSDYVSKASIYMRPYGLMDTGISPSPLISQHFIRHRISMKS